MIRFGSCFKMCILGKAEEKKMKARPPKEIRLQSDGSVEERKHCQHLKEPFLVAIKLKSHAKFRDYLS